VLGCESGSTDPDANATVPTHLWVHVNEPAKAAPLCVAVKLNPQLEKECLPPVHVPVMLGPTVTEVPVAGTGSPLPSLIRNVTLKVPLAV
jgi:hypothetical protein